MDIAGYVSDDTREVTTRRLTGMKQGGEKVSILASYDYTIAQIIDGAGIDIILVGDSASDVMAGSITMLPITLDQMIHHGKSVVCGVKRTMAVVDIPLGSYRGSEMKGLASVTRIIKESHADTLKLGGGGEIFDATKRILSTGVSVMGRFGPMSQSINEYGIHTVRVEDNAEARKLIRSARLSGETGRLELVFEGIPIALAARVASELTILVIGIGAGGDMDEQVSIIQNMLGVSSGFRPRFLRRYTDLYTAMTGAVSHYVSDVKSCDFSDGKGQY